MGRHPTFWLGHTTVVYYQQSDDVMLSITMLLAKCVMACCLDFLCHHYLTGNHRQLGHQVNTPR